MLHQFTLIYWKDAGCYVGRLKEVPGFFGQGKTLEELEENIQDASHSIVDCELERNENEFSRKELEIEVDATPNLIKSVRRYRLTMLGLGEQEIDEFCNFDEYPGTIDDELRQIAAYKRAQERSRFMNWHG